MTIGVSASGIFRQFIPRLPSSLTDVQIHHKLIPDTDRSQGALGQSGTQQSLPEIKNEETDGIEGLNTSYLEYPLL